MALNPLYFVRETSSNLWRNIGLTVAAMLTVAVTLIMVGSSLLISKGSSRSTAQFKDGVEFIVYMNADAAPEQHAAIESLIDSSPDISSSEFVDQQASYQEFTELFADEPELLAAVTPEDMPPSFRVVPANSEAVAVEDLASQFEGRPGVRKVKTASEVIRFIEEFGSTVTTAFWFAAVILVIVSVLLILNTVFTAIGARRREIEVMKLVGATNWFIRIPFMLEGLVHGVVGGVLAAIGLRFVDRFVFKALQDSEEVALFQNFAVTSAEVLETGLLMVALGAAVGVIGSAFAVTRYLDV